MVQELRRDNRSKRFGGNGGASASPRRTAISTPAGDLGGRHRHSHRIAVEADNRRVNMIVTAPAHDLGGDIAAAGADIEHGKLP